jgi:ABC-2 type transport system ATP-binding protein
MTDPAIHVTGLRRTYGSGADAFEAVRGIDLTVPRGTVHALLGVNGAGKTSALEVVEGLSTPSAGTVEVLGLDPLRDRQDVRRRVGVLLQRSGFAGDLTVVETLRMWAATLTAPRPVGELLEMLDLRGRADVRMRALSGGEQRRVDLACTLMGRPEVVVLDEPTTGLDPESRRRVWSLVRDLREEGATVLLTTHYLDEAEALADRIDIMRSGEIVLSGTPAEISSSQPSEIRFDAGVDTDTLPSLGRLHADGASVVIQVDDLQPRLTELLDWARHRDVTLPRLSARTATLESVFLAVAEEHLDDDDTARSRA